MDDTLIDDSVDDDDVNIGNRNIPDNDIQVDADEPLAYHQKMKIVRQRL